MLSSVQTQTALASAIEHTWLKPDGPDAQIEQLCQEAKQYGFAAVVVHPVEIERCCTLLSDATVKVATVVGFPLGQNSSRVKAFETADALQRGATEIDMVINIRALQNGAINIITEELTTLAESCRDASATSKIILETCYLSNEQKRQACKIALDARIDFVKTSTGFGNAGAHLDDVRLMRSVVGDAVGVKASGGIRDLATVQAMIAAGATRIGTSSGVAIMLEYLERDIA